MVVALVRSWARTDLVLMGSLGLLLLAGVLTPEAAFAGFSNPAVISIGALFVVAAGVDRTGALGFLDGLLRPRGRRIGPAVVRLFVPTAILSGVLSNTPVVAMLIPRVQAWAREMEISASKLLIPLSTAAIVGGWLTLIGTSTNVVVHGLMQAEGLDGFSFFDVTWVGVPAALAVAAWYALIGHRLLPDREGADPAKISIAGDSAGSGLTVATLVSLRDEGIPLPAASVCLSPWVDMEGLGQSMTTKAEADPMVQREALVKMGKTYLGGADARTPLAAPLYADLTGLPPMLIQVGTSETLLDDATRLAEKAGEAGVDVHLEPWEGAIHVWQFYASRVPEAKEAVERIGRFILQHT